MAGGKQIGGDADCTVFAGTVGGGDCGGGEGVVNMVFNFKYSKNCKFKMDDQ